MIHLIVATDLGRGIGAGGALLYYLKEDMRYFKALTTGNTVIMGRKTFESLPKGALPNRRNIIITGTPGWTAPDVEVAATPAQALEMAAEGSGDTFIIGGGSIYAAMLEDADILDITVVHDRATAADTFFPVIDIDKYQVTKIVPITGATILALRPLSRGAKFCARPSN